MKFDIDSAVEKINDRLKQANNPVTVYLAGKKLALYATLPKKNGAGKRQQKISLGIPATSDGLKRIETEAHLLGQRIANGMFSWADYTREEKRPERMSIADLLPQFREHYLATKKIKVTTYDDTWARTFGKLPQNDTLSPENLMLVVLSTVAESSNRKLTCQRLQALADYAGIKADVLQYQGHYDSVDDATPRDIPEDRLILEWRDRIPNKAWQWVYGMMACYGLRPHEVFFCEFEDQHSNEVLNVLKGKTGAHQTYPIPPEWADEWNLQKVVLPNVGRERAFTFKTYGDRVRRQFQRYGVPFRPYDLRHAFAIRASVTEGLPTSTAASMMGHSVAVHTRTYHKWLKSSTNQQVYRKIVKKQAKDS